MKKAFYGLILPVTALNAFCIFVLMAIFYGIMTKFLNPLKTITAFAEKVAQENLKERVIIQTQDEMGQLSASFNHMTSGLKDMIHSVNDTSDKLHAFSSDVSASVEENVQSIHQVVENIQLVADETREQLHSAQHVEQVVTEMGDEVTQIAHNMNEVKQASTTAEQQTNDGVAVMDSVMSLQQRKEQDVSSVAAITAATQKVSDNVEQVAATTEEQNASMEQMAVAAEKLAVQAKVLQETIKKIEI